VPPLGLNTVVEGAERLAIATLMHSLPEKARSNIPGFFVISLSLIAHDVLTSLSQVLYLSGCHDIITSIICCLSFLLFLKVPIANSTDVTLDIHPGGAGQEIILCLC
jgi:hypothetical protein